MNANSDINNQIVGIIMDKSTRINTKCIRISEIYYKYIYTNVPRPVRSRPFIEMKLSNYIRSYYSKTIPHKSNIRIMDICGGNGDVLKNIGSLLGIPKNNLYCVEPKQRHKYPVTTQDKITHVIWDNANIPTIPPNILDVVIIMVSLHHMTRTMRITLMDNIKVLAKPKSLLIIKEYDCVDKEDETVITWEHALVDLRDHPLATSKNIKSIRGYYEDYKSKQYWDNLICSNGYVDAMSTIMQDPPNKTQYNPTNLYWNVYIKLD